jgi:hypothetical protein
MEFSSQDGRNRKDSRLRGIGLVAGLFLLFLWLKLGGVIDWSWWLVFSPYWITSLLALVVFGLFVIADRYSKR